MRTLANIVGFQLVWAAAVGGAARGWAWAGPLACALFAALHFAFTERRRSDLTLLATCALLGVVLDSLWAASGLLRFASAWPSTQFAPAWILAMWCGFALTIDHSLASLRRRLWLAALLGAVGAPLAYAVAAYSWQAVVVAPGPLPWLALGLSWALVTPALLVFAGRLAPRPS